MTTVTKRGSGGTGRRARLRGVWSIPYGFKSRLPHTRTAAIAAVFFCASGGGICPSLPEGKKGMKRYAFRILCPYAGRAPGGTISGRRPPVRVPWPYGITLQLVPESKFDLASHGSRAISACTVEPMHGTSSVGFAGISGAHWAQGRADGMLKLFFCLRARFEIQTDVQTEPRDQKTVWAKYEVLRSGGCFT